jgi:signal peptidase II
MRTEARAVVAVTAEPMHVPPTRYPLFVALAIGGLSFDLWTKSTVFAALGCPGRAAWEWRGGDLVRFTLQTNFNHGALWGLGQGWAPYFAALSVVAVLAILYFLFVKKYAQSAWLTVALAFVTSGALGNLYDRLGWHGWQGPNGPILAVRDFLYFRFFEAFDWAIFNFADSFLVTGAIMLVIHSLWTPAGQPVQSATPQPHVAA